MKNIVGIDLGTTNSVMAYLDEAGNPKIQVNVAGENVTPSAVWIDEDKNVLIGTEALRQQEQGLKVWTNYKRDIASDTVYDTINGTDITPETLSTFVLTKMRKDFESVRTDPVATCTVTFPANFTNERREATLMAAKLAEWPVDQGINEPSAAALYFAMQQNLKPGKYAVYDFGGGTWDISIIEVEGTEITVTETAGIQQCGGKDFDARLQSIVEEKFTAETGANIDYSLQSSGIFEGLKKSLTVSAKRNITIRQPNGPPTNLEITRDEFEKAIASILSGTEIICSSLLEKHPDIIDVFLVGGSTRVPAVKQSLAKVFGRDGLTVANPDEVVALGAALYSGVRTSKKNLTAVQADLLQEVKFNEIANHYFGVSAMVRDEQTGQNELIATYVVDKGTKIPCKRTKTYYTMYKNQSVVEMEVLQSVEPETDLRFVKELWKGDLPLPSGLPASDPIEVTFRISEDGTIHGSFSHVASGNKKDFSIAPQYEVDDTKKSDIDEFLLE